MSYHYHNWIIMIDYRKIRAIIREFLKVYQTLEKPNRDYVNDQIHMDELKKCDSLRGFYYWLRWLEETAYVRDDELDEDKEMALSMFAPFYQLVDKLSPEEHLQAFKGVRRIVEHEGIQFGYDNVLKMIREIELIHSVDPDSAIIYRGSLNDYIAVGKVADLIYEKLGWQTATITFDKPYSIMAISEEGYKVLNKTIGCFDSRGRLEFDFVLLDEENEKCLDFSLSQQVIDYFRMKSNKQTICLSTQRLISRVEEKNGVRAETSFPFMRLKGEDLFIYSEKASSFPMAFGHSWLIGVDDLGLINVLAEILMSQLKAYHDNSFWYALREDAHNAGCSETYYKMKDLYDGKILMLDYQGIIESYDDDAVTLAWKYGLPLWCRKTGEELPAPMVIIPCDMANRILEEEPDAVIEDAGMEDSMDLMALWPNALNYGLRDQTDYKDATVFKRKNGKYVVRASLDGKKLPQRVLKDEMVKVYETYTKGVMRDAVMKQILWYAYTINEGKDFKPSEYLGI